MTFCRVDGMLSWAYFAKSTIDLLIDFKERVNTALSNYSSASNPSICLLIIFLITINIIDLNLNSDGLSSS